MASTITLKKSSTPGNVPNNTNITTAELALNTADRILYSSDGSSVFEIGANLSSLSVAGITYPTSDGTSGQVLTTNGSGNLSFTDASGGGLTQEQQDILEILQDDSSYFYTAIGDLYTKAEPSGSDTYIQYNNSGIFGSDSTFTFNDGTNTLSVPNIVISSQSTLTNLSVSGTTDFDIVTANTIATDGNVTIGGTLNTYSIDAIYDRGILNSDDSAYFYTKIEEIEGRNLKEFGDTFTLPTTDGTNGQVLLTNGSGTISFGDVSLGLTLLTAETVTTANVAAVDIDIPAEYTRFKLCLDDITNDAASYALHARITVSTDGGNTFISSADHNVVTQGLTYGSTSVTWSSSNNLTFFLATQTDGIGNNSPQSAVHEITVSDDMFVMQGFYDTDRFAGFISNRRGMAARVDTIRISLNSSNFATGRIALYGYKETI